MTTKGYHRRVSVFLFIFLAAPWLSNWANTRYAEFTRVNNNESVVDSLVEHYVHLANTITRVHTQ